MSRIPLSTFFLAGLFATAAGSTALPLQVQNALTTIDTVPTSGELDTVFVTHQDALDSLTVIAQDAATDPGIRLRAIHALTNYCVLVPDTNNHLTCPDGDAAHQALHALVVGNVEERSGSGIVMLRGAIEALGPQRVGTDLATLVPLLDHPSRDIRAATAHALRDLCNTQAINPLRVRYQHEATDQVRLAISEALRVLGQPLACQ